MDTIAGHNSSYTWKSIMVGKEVLERGLKWKVESRSASNIWQDPWLPSKQNFRVGETRIRMDSLMKVS